MATQLSLQLSSSKKLHDFIYGFFNNAEAAGDVE
jgi:hypothetical protein